MRGLSVVAVICGVRFFWLPLFLLLGAGCGSATSVGARVVSESAQGDSGKAVVCSGVASAARWHALRLAPGADLRKQIEAFVRDRRIGAGAIVTAVGSLRQASLRLANQNAPSEWKKKFEIVSLVGTVGIGGVHLHASLSDDTGATIGGHLVEGCIVYTTAEIVIVELDGLEFDRADDASTGFRELQIRPRLPSPPKESGK